MSRQVATPNTQEPGRDTSSDRPRQRATGESERPEKVGQLERELERLNDDRDFLRAQIKVKDGQIASLLERDRETNILIGKLQEMLTPLLGPPRDPPMESGDRQAP